MQQPVATLGGTDLADRAGRAGAVGAVLEALRAASGWTGPAGVVRLVLDLPDGGHEPWTFGFGPAGISETDAEPQVVVTATLDDVLRLAVGDADVALLYLSGALRVVGDETLLLGIGTRIATASGRPLIDAAALDPLAVSAAIADAPLAHLAAVMAGGFRDLVLTEVFRRVPEFVIAEKAARVTVAVAFEVGGRRDGGTDRYVVRIENGDCTVIAGADPDAPVDATLVLEGHEFLRLVLGHLNPVRGVLSGQLQVRGQMLKALGFNSVMRIPGGEVLDR